MKKTIFISYSHSDLTVVLWLREELKRRGYLVWLDSNSIKVGQIWREEIVEGIETSDYFMIILSARSIKSTNVVKELSLAESCGKIILPVLIENNVEIPAKMKYQLAGVQFIVLDRDNSEENIDLLVNGLKNLAIGVGTDFLSQQMLRRGYVLQECISRISREKTFRIQDVDRGRVAVLKVFNAPETLIKQFSSESKELEGLRQQGIPLIWDHFYSEGRYFLVQEHMQGTPWDEVKWNPEFITIQTRKILVLLSAMHDRGIVHNDIRPQNLLYNQETNESFIVDLTLSKTSLLLNEGTPQTKVIFSREYFRSPELVRFSLLSPASDLYALGVTLLTLLSDQPPESLYQKETGCWLMDRVDPSIQSWLTPLLMDSSSERIQCAKEVINLMDMQDPHGVSIGRTTIQASESSPIIWSRQKLIDCLILSIGPVAENLLQEYKESLDSSDQTAIRNKCKESGIDLNFLEDCFLKAQQASPSPPVINKDNHPLANKSSNSAEILPWLVSKIGPAAKLFWDDPMIEELMHSPESARLRLNRMGVPDNVIDELVLKISSDSPNPRIKANPENQTPSLIRAPETTIENDSKDLFSETNLKEILVRQLGPVAISVHDAYKSESDLQRRATLILDRLSKLGVSEESLQKLRNELSNR